MLKSEGPAEFSQEEEKGKTIGRKKFEGSKSVQLEEVAQRMSSPRSQGNSSMVKGWGGEQQTVQEWIEAHGRC